jgi:hypothetical protein
MRRLATAAAVLGAGGCVLFVSPTTYPTTCAFAGETSQCGACLAASCQTEIDACCGDDGCAGSVLASLESCTTAHTCDALLGASGPLPACVKTKCAAVCVTLTGTSQTSCLEPPLAAGFGCTCTFGAPDGPNDFACSSAIYASARCCAPAGWPAPGLACTCAPLACNATTDGCFCSLAETTPTETSCSASTCCVENDTCTCRAKGCFSFETPVPSCDVTAVGCRPGQVRVDSCSLRTP